MNPRPEPVTAEAPRRVGRALLRQSWLDVGFVHWAVEPDSIAGLLPPGTVPDVFDSKTYVGLVPFRMSRTALLATPPIPYLGSFLETNVRLYCVDDHGRRGVVFLSLDAARLVPVLFGRWAFGLPYAWSTMRVTRDGDTVGYHCRRRWPQPRDREPGRRRSVRPAPSGAGVVRLEVAAPIGAASPLEHFLTARWGLCERHLGRTRYLPNVHQSWPLHRARLLECDTGLLAAAGIPVGDTEPVSVLFSPGVDVRFGRPLPVGPGH